MIAAKFLLVFLLSSLEVAFAGRRKVESQLACYRKQCPVPTEPPPPPPTAKSPEFDKLDGLERQCEHDGACQAAMDMPFAEVRDATSGIAVTQKLSGILSSATVGRSITKFAETITKLADRLGPFLKALGPLSRVVMMFFKSAEERLLEQLLEEVKTQFNRVNQRFDMVFEKLADMRGLIKVQHLRTRYREAKDRITHSTAALERVFKAPKGAIQGYVMQLKQIDGMKVVEFAVYRLCEVLLAGTEMEDVFIEVEKANRKRVHARLLEHYNLIAQGVKFYLTWLQMKSEDVQAYNKAFQDEVRSEMEDRLRAVLNKIEQIDEKHFTNNWQNQYKIDFENLVKTGGNKNDIAERVYNYVSGKYDWRDWMVIIYDAIDGKEVHRHYIDKPCQTSVIHYGWHGVNALLVHVDANKDAPDADKTKALLEKTTTERVHRQCGGGRCWNRHENTNNAKVSFESLPAELRDQCKYSVTAVIKTDLHVHIQAPTSRLNVLTRHGVHAIAMG